MQPDTTVTTRRTVKQPPETRHARLTLHDRNKNRKGVTAALAAPGAVEKSETMPLAPVLDTSASNVHSRQQSARAADSAHVEADALAQVLHDSAVVKHHVRQLSQLVSAVVQLPPDPCVVKVVTSAVVAVTAAAAVSSGDEQHDGPRDASFAPPSSPHAGATVLGSSAAPASASAAAAENAQLSRRGLRVEAAPWRPSGAFAFIPDTAALTNVSASFPVAAPVTAAVLFTPPVAIPTAAAAAAVPAVTITSTLTEVAVTHTAASTEAALPHASPHTPPTFVQPSNGSTERLMEGSTRPLLDSSASSFALSPSTPQAAAAPATTTTTTTVSVTARGSSFSPSPHSSVVREDDKESGGGTPVLPSPALLHHTTPNAASAAAAAAAAAAAVVEERPATAPAIRRPAMTVTNTATGARMSSSTHTTPSGAPAGQWGVADSAGHLRLTGTTQGASGVGGGGGGSGAVRTTAAHSANTAACSAQEFPAMPVPPSMAETATTPPTAHFSSPQQQRQSLHSLASFNASGSNANWTDLGSAATATTTSAAAGAAGGADGSHSSPVGGDASHSGRSSYSGSPHLSLPNANALPFSSSHFPRNGSSTAVNAAGATSSSLLFQSASYVGFSPPMQGESDLDRVRHNRVAVSDMAAKNETTLVDTLFADAEADVVEDDESEMDLDDGRGSTAGSDVWPAYPMGSSPHAGVSSPDSVTRAYVKQQQRFFASSPTVTGAGPSFGGGYWYQPGSGAGQRHQPGGNTANRARFSPDNGVHRTISTSCASVASSTMSLLDPRQPPADRGAAAYDAGEDEEEWEMNSSAYADSLDEAQILWIEEQLKATENPVGFF